MHRERCSAAAMGRPLETTPASSATSVARETTALKKPNAMGIHLKANASPSTPLSLHLRPPSLTQARVGGT
jgi:hypothetical protein